MTPYYSRPSQQGLIAHFSAIADATDLPVLLYNIPWRTGRRIEVDTLARLAQHPRIVAVKDAVGDLTFTTTTRLAVGEDFAIYSGDDIHTLPMMAVGAVGVVSVAAHLAGKQIKAMVEAALPGTGDGHAAASGAGPAGRGAVPRTQSAAGQGSPQRLWEPVGDPRSPLVPASEATVRGQGGAGDGATAMTCQVTFLGGLGDIGRNCAALEIDGKIALIDCGLMFPEEDMLGVDLVLPDFSLVDRASRRRRMRRADPRP